MKRYRVVTEMPDWPDGVIVIRKAGDMAAIAHIPDILPDRPGITHKTIAMEPFEKVLKNAEIKSSQRNGAEIIVWEVVS